MKSKIISRVYPIIGASLSGFLLVLAFPEPDIGWLAWIGLVPLLIVIYGKSLKFGFCVSYLCGLIFFAVVFNWIFEVSGYTIVNHIINDLYLGSFFAVFGLTFNFLSKHWGASPAFLATPFIWVSLEYVRSSLSFLSLPWALLAHSQHQYLPVIQIASLTGAYSISFLIVMFNAALAAAILNFFARTERNKRLKCAPPTRRIVISLTLLIVPLIAITLIYGQTSLLQEFGGKEIKVSVIQGNIPQEKKWDRKFANFIMQRYADLTKEAARDEPNLIVWPEAATPGFIFKNPALREKMMGITKTVNTHLIVGSTEFPKFKVESSDQGKVGNTAVFFSPKGEVLGQYLKIRLVPFVEYLPFDRTITWPKFIVPDKNVNWELPGQESTLFELDGEKFGVTICWESHFPGIFRKFVKKGANNFMLNIANEGRYGETSASYQLLSMTLFRAVENRVAIARANNTGISCFIDPFGRIIGRVQEGGKDIFVKGYLTKKIPLSHKKTFYNKCGYIFVYINLVITCLFIAMTLIKIKRR